MLCFDIWQAYKTLNYLCAYFEYKLSTKYDYVKETQFLL